MFTVESLNSCINAFDYLLIKSSSKILEIELIPYLKDFNILKALKFSKLSSNLFITGSSPSPDKFLNPHQIKVP